MSKKLKAYVPFAVLAFDNPRANIMSTKILLNKCL